MPGRPDADHHHRKTLLYPERHQVNPINVMNDDTYVDEHTGHAANWLSKLFTAGERRRAQRYPSPPVMAFYWDGGIPTPHAVPDISRTGIFVKTEGRWSPRTLLRVTLQRKTEDSQEPGETITVQCRVVRAGKDGVGLAIMLADEKKRNRPVALGSLATRKQLHEFLKRLLADTTETP